MLYYSLINSNGDVTFENYKKIFQPNNIKVFLNSIGQYIHNFVPSFRISCGIHSFKGESEYRTLLMLLLVIPMWMNFLLRTYAWMSIIGRNGILNSFLKFLGLPAVNILYTDTAVVLGMIYNFYPL